MTENQTQTPNRAISRLSARRLVLLASVAGLGLAVLFSDPGGYSPLPQLGVPQAHAALAQSPGSFADLAAKVKPAVVSVRVKIDQNANSSDQEQGEDANPFEPDSPFRRFFRDLPGTPNGMQNHRTITGVGSGFFISADGYAVTNYHVVDHANSVQVTADDGTVYTAKVVGTDQKSDLALIKVDANKQFAFVKFADETPRVGDWVVAVGNPFGLGGTVTAGIVSARGRAISSNPYSDYMQIDAPINKGNSGGPTFDVNGDVVGVNTAIYSPSGGSVGIGFDIPANVAKEIVAQLKDKGHVARGQLGVQVQPVTAAIADGLGLKEARGALVDQPQAGSPAAKAGIKSGDVITAVNGTAVKDSGELARRIGAMAPGSSVELSILRNGEQQTVSVTLAKQSDQQQARTESEETANHASLAQLGLTVAPARGNLGAGNSGVVVTNVDPESPAGEGGIQAGDLILGIGGKSVSTPADLRSAIGEASSAGKHSVLLRVRNSNGMRYVALPIGNG
jgi:serine protease Do